MQMSRQWMYGDRRNPEFIDGMHKFLRVAETNKKQNGFISCPCSVCQNMKDYSSSKTLHFHLLQSGFMSGYNCWTKHGEPGLIMEDNEEGEDDDNYPMFTTHGGTTVGKTKLKKRSLLMSTTMIFVGPFMMHR